MDVWPEEFEEALAKVRTLPTLLPLMHSLLLHLVNRVL
jgi:hypothetical protein